MSFTFEGVDKTGKCTGDGSVTARAYVATLPLAAAAHALSLFPPPATPAAHAARVRSVRNSGERETTLTVCSIDLKVRETDYTKLYNESFPRDTNKCASGVKAPPLYYNCAVSSWCSNLNISRCVTVCTFEYVSFCSETWSYFGAQLIKPLCAKLVITIVELSRSFKTKVRFPNVA